MKKNMKLMHIYEIQKLHQLHRDKLHTIKAVNNKLKTYQSVCSNVQKINNYKRNKINSQSFTQKQKYHRIQSQNKNLHSRMMMTSTQRNINSRREKTSKGEVESQHRKHQSVNQKLYRENVKLKERLVNTKSSFQHNNIDKTVRASRKFSHQNQVVHLLEKHLKIKPTVIFPTLNSSTIKRAQLKQRKKHFKQSRIAKNKLSVELDQDKSNRHHSVDVIKLQKQL